MSLEIIANAENVKSAVARWR